MSTYVLPRPASPTARYGLAEVARSEWTKFTSLRSTRWTLALFPVLAIGLGLVIGATTGAHWPHMSAGGRAHWDPTNNLLAALIPGYLALPVLGVLMVTSEYGSGAIRSTLAAVPRRGLLLAAKAVVFATVAFVTCEVVTFATFFAGQSVMGPAPHASLGQPGVVRALVLSGAFLVLMGLFGLGLGALLRNSAAAVATYAGLAVLAPQILHVLPGNAGRFGPIIMLANSVSDVKVRAGFLAPWAAIALMAVYAAVALAAGATRMVAGDA